MRQNFSRPPVKSPEQPIQCESLLTLSLAGTSVQSPPPLPPPIQPSVHSSSQPVLSASALCQPLGLGQEHSYIQVNKTNNTARRAVDYIGLVTRVLSHLDEGSLACFKIAFSDENNTGGVLISRATTAQYERKCLNLFQKIASPIFTQHDFSIKLSQLSKLPADQHFSVVTHQLIPTLKQMRVISKSKRLPSSIRHTFTRELAALPLAPGITDTNKHCRSVIHSEFTKTLRVYEVAREFGSTLAGLLYDIANDYKWPAHFFREYAPITHCAQMLLNDLANPKILKTRMTERLTARCAAIPQMAELLEIDRSGPVAKGSSFFRQVAIQFAIDYGARGTLAEWDLAQPESCNPYAHALANNQLDVIKGLLRHDQTPESKVDSCGLAPHNNVIDTLICTMHQTDAANAEIEPLLIQILTQGANIHREYTSSRPHGLLNMSMLEAAEASKRTRLVDVLKAFGASKFVTPSSAHASAKSFMTALESYGVESFEGAKQDEPTKRSLSCSMTTKATEISSDSEPDNRPIHRTRTITNLNSFSSESEQPFGEAASPQWLPRG